MTFAQFYQMCSLQTQRFLEVWLCNDLSLHEFLLCGTMQVQYEVLSDLSGKQSIRWQDGVPFFLVPASVVFE